MTAIAGQDIKIDFVMTETLKQLEEVIIKSSNPAIEGNKATTSPQNVVNSLAPHIPCKTN